MLFARNVLVLERRNWSHVSVFTLLSCVWTVSLFAEDPPEEKQKREDPIAVQRLELMQQRIDAAEVTSDESEFPSHFQPKPIFRYSDQARGHLSAAVWVLGDTGRPKALIASELDRYSHGKPCLAYEYISMTKTPFSVRGTEINWTPKGTLFEFKALPKAPAPEATFSRRLIQMRELASRFAAHEVVKNETCELRLLPRPVYRYTPSTVENSDGGIFFLTFGTNPEVILIVESNGRSWEFSAGRMTGAEVVELTLDGKLVWSGPPLQHGLDAPSTGDIFPVQIPGLNKDGSELKE